MILVLITTISFAAGYICGYFWPKESDYGPRW